ncbi:protein novo proteiN.94A [Caudoviricetes sp.]|nr:protein novo proteiN.94A [Caudoviricetes sp.]
MTDELQRDIGRMEAEMAALKFSMDQMREDLKTIKSDIAGFRQHFAELKGGYKTLLGLAAVVGAVMGQGLQWWLGKGH